MSIVFILSTERAGSTLLSSMLAGSDVVFVPPELHVLVYKTIKELKSDYPVSVSSLKEMNDLLSVVDADAEKILSAIDDVELYYKAVESMLGSKFHLVDKTPRYSRSKSTLEKTKIFDARYIWLIRHPLSVSYSKIEAKRRIRNKLKEKRKRSALFLLSKLGDFRDYFFEKNHMDFDREIESWLLYNNNISLFFGQLMGDDRYKYCKIHYEDLVSNPKSTIQTVCSSINIPFQEKMMSPWGNLPSNLEWGVGDEKIKSMKSISTDSLYRWKGAVDDKVVMAKFLTQIRTHGYDVLD